MSEDSMKLEKSQAVFRAHIIAETGEYQSVKEHLKNVALLTSKNAKSIGLEKLGYLLGLLHDCGKYTQIFDQYLERAVCDPKNAKRGSVNHTTSGAKLIFDNYHNQPDKLYQFVAELLSVTISSHHGIYDCLTLDGKNQFRDKMQTTKEIFYDEAYLNFCSEILSEQELTKMFDDSVQEIKVFLNKCKERTGFSFALLERMLLSCLVDADWTDTTNFMNGKMLDESKDYDDLSSLWKSLADHLEMKISYFTADTEINKLRKKISDECLVSAKKPGGTYRLIVPTGGGKTLSSLRFALNHACEYGKGHVFFIIPFLSILEQNADVIRKYVGNEDVVFEHHSNVINEPVKEPNEEETYKNERYKALTQNWDSPIVITTMVQLLNTLFLGKLQSIRRMHALANSIIIFDEIQSLPIKMISLFNMAVNFLVDTCGATVVLCSATQPSLDKVTHPIRVCTTGLTENTDESFRAFKRTELIDLTKTKPGGFSLLEVAELANELMEEKESLLVICNTKSEATGIYQNLKQMNQALPSNRQYKLFHLSTLMCAEHRAFVLKQIKDLIGNDRVVCISTQLIEAGVDISFECVVRVVAGLDSMIQAAGRCNRNGEADCGAVYIINVHDEKLGSLEEMKTAQQACQRLLDDFSDSPKTFEDDLLSMLAMKYFYQYYYTEVQNKMDYSLPNINTSIVDLLWKNSNGKEAYEGRVGIELADQFYAQAFETAGKNFEVIPDNTTDILVPYNTDAKDLIAELNGELTLPDIIKAVKKTQRLSVSLYDNTKAILLKVGAIYTLKNGEILALKEEYYDKILGVVIDPNPMEFMNVCKEERHGSS